MPLSGKKHEIHHNPATLQTTVTDVMTPAVRSAAEVHRLLAQAGARRRVAATVMNERSSRSHEVFTLRVRGAKGQAELPVWFFRILTGLIL